MKLDQKVFRKILLVAATFVLVFGVFYSVYLYNQKNLETENLLEQQKQVLSKTAEELNQLKQGVETTQAQTQKDNAALKKQLGDEKNKQQSIVESERLKREALEKKIADIESQNVAPQNQTQANFDVNIWVPDVVLVLCPGDRYGNNWNSGTGVLWDYSQTQPKTAYILTNQHVVETDDGSNWGPCLIGRTNNIAVKPKFLFIAEAWKIHKYADLVSLKITETYPLGGSLPNSYSNFSTCFAKEADVKIGDKTIVLGYPSIGGSTITLTEGVISGRIENFWKTSAKIDQGNSGGVALTGSGCFLGIPTATIIGSSESLGYVLDNQSVIDMLSAL